MKNQEKSIFIEKTDYEILSEMDKLLDKLNDLCGELESVTELNNSTDKKVQKLVDDLGVDIENAAFGCFSLKKKIA